MAIYLGSLQSISIHIHIYLWKPDISNHYITVISNGMIPCNVSAPSVFLLNKEKQYDWKEIQIPIIQIITNQWV